MVVVAGILGLLAIALACVVVAIIGAPIVYFMEDDWPDDASSWFFSFIMGMCGAIVIGLVVGGAVGLGCEMIGGC